MKFHKPSTAKKDKFKEYLFLNICAKERGKTVLIKEIKNITQIKTHSLLYFVRKKNYPTLCDVLFPFCT